MAPTIRPHIAVALARESYVTNGLFMVYSFGFITPELRRTVYRVAWYRLLPWLMGGTDGQLPSGLAVRSGLKHGGAFMSKRVPPLQRRSKEPIPT